MGSVTVDADMPIIQYAAVMGIHKELNLKDNEFSNVATFLFVALLCFEVPNSTSLTAPYKHVSP